MTDDADQMLSRRNEVLGRLVALARDDTRIAAVWLQGSLARGDSDAASDIDAYLAIEDASLEAIFADRAELLERIAHPLAWSDATTTGLKAVHALLAGGVKLDLFFEPLSGLASTKRPAVKVLFDKAACAAQLQTGFEPPMAYIRMALTVIVKMTRQGATWPLRLLHRGQWSSLAMMEIDLINAQLTQLMALQADPAHFFTNPFSLYRALTCAQQGEIDRLTQRALAAAAASDASALKAVHLDVYDALVREARTACAALGIDYPLQKQDDDDIRALLDKEWPS